MPIQILNDRVFVLNTQATTYAIFINEQGLPLNAYWGPLVARAEDFADAAFRLEPLAFPVQQLLPEEYSPAGGLRHRETALKARFADGTADLRWALCGYEATGEQLCLRLKDERYPFEACLHYRLHPEQDILERWCRVQNNGAEPVLLERCFSAQFSLPGADYQSVNFTGRWSGEFQQHSAPVGCGKQVYESLYGLTGHQCGPFFAVHQGASETQGSVWFGALAYSGNFKVVAENLCGQQLSLLAGISDAEFGWPLGPGESFEAPHLFAGCGVGFGGMSRALHRLCLQTLLPRPLAQKELPVLYNSWYATEFGVEVAQQCALAQKAAALGVELFVMDDGWFKGRTGDAAGLGDWQPDPVKFPQGLGSLIETVEGLGMRFGLWVEPEMVNPNSDLYRAHPDWILRYPNRQPLTWRNQYMLDMASPLVQEHLFEALHRLLGENHITYLKWDMNRYVAEVGSALCADGQQKALLHRHTLGVYALARRLRAAHPAVELEACASGGGRVDLGALQCFDEFWPSDNTDPLDRLAMQQHCSLLYPAKCMRAWLTGDTAFNGRTVPLRFMAHAAMCGALGIGTDLCAESEERLAELAGYVAQYKAIRPVVQLGELYRLASLETGPVQLVQYQTDGRGLVFAFLPHGQYGRRFYPFRLQGLVSSAVYRFQVNGTALEKSGAYLMGHGLTLELHGDWASQLVQLERIV